MNTEPMAARIPDAASSTDLSEFAHLLVALTGALSDSAVERAAGLTAEWASLLGDPDFLHLASRLRPLLRPLSDFVDGLQALAAAGVLQKLLDGLALFAALVDALTPEQVERFVGFVEGLFSLTALVLREDVNVLARESLTEVRSAWADAGTVTRGSGFGELWRLLQDPTVRRAVRTAQYLARAASHDRAADSPRQP